MDLGLLLKKKKHTHTQNWVSKNVHNFQFGVQRIDGG